MESFPSRIVHIMRIKIRLFVVHWDILKVAKYLFLKKKSFFLAGAVGKRFSEANKLSRLNERKYRNKLRNIASICAFSVLIF